MEAERKRPGHERCSHHWRLLRLGNYPDATAPWRHYVFRVHCVVTGRWMKIRVPFAYFWWGSKDYGMPEVEVGEIMNSNPTPPEIPGAPRLVEDTRSEEEKRLDKIERLAQSAHDATHPQGNGR
jgi:hypothetical protein